MDLIILFVILVLASVWDIWKLEIPNALVIVGSLIGISVTFLLPNSMMWHEDYNLISRLISALSIFIIGFLVWSFFEITKLRLIGGGDLKLLTMIACFIPFKTSIYIFLYSIIVASIIVFFYIPLRETKKMLNYNLYFIFYSFPATQNLKAKHFPFAVPILIATLITFLF